MMAEDLPIYIGTSGWCYDHWLGKFYPEDLHKSNWFEFYARRFSVVEINATFYRFFTKSTYRKWHSQAPANFLYFLKFPKIITHHHQLRDCDAMIRAFCRVVEHLEEHFGGCLLQICPGMPYEPLLLKNALEIMHFPEKVAVELRNTEWITAEVAEVIKEAGAVFCNADSPSAELLNWRIGRFSYIRLHGHTSWYNYKYSDEELYQVADRAMKELNDGAEAVYIFFNNDCEGFAVDNAVRLYDIIHSEK